MSRYTASHCRPMHTAAHTGEAAWACSASVMTAMDTALPVSIFAVLQFAALGIIMGIIPLQSLIMICLLIPLMMPKEPCASS